MKRRALLLGVLVIVAGMVAGGATLSYFFDTAVNGSNTFTAGTVEISVDRDMGDTPSTGPMFYSDASQGSYPISQWAPGDTHSRYLNVHNDGSLDVRLARIRAEVTGLENDPAAYSEFIANMKVRVDFIVPSPFGTSQVYNIVAAQPLANFLGEGAGVVAPAGNPSAPLVSRGATKNFCFTATLDEDAGNPLQGKAPVVSFTVVAEQAANNP